MTISATDLFNEAAVIPLLQAQSLEKKVISEAEAQHVAGLLEAQLQAESEGQNRQGLDQEEPKQEVAAQSLILAKELAYFARIPANSERLGEAGAVTAAVNLLKTTSSDTQNASWAICLRNLVAHSGANKRIAIEAGAAEPLLRLCFSDVEWVQLPVVIALANLSRSSDTEELTAEEIRAKLIDAGAINAMLHLLKSETKELADYGAFLACELSTDYLRCEAMGAAGMIPLLIPLLGAKFEVAQVYATGALFNLARRRANRWRVANAEGISALVRLLRSSPPSGEYAAGAIMNLATDIPFHESIIQAKGVPWLLETLQRGSETAQKNAAGALMNLSTNPAIRTSVAMAASPLEKISFTSKDRDIKRLASLAASNLAPQKTIGFAFEGQEVGKSILTCISGLHANLSSIFKKVKKVEEHCKAASLWM